MVEILVSAFLAASHASEVREFDTTLVRDGKSSLYAVASSGEATIYRQPRRDGKLVGAPQLVFKAPFDFSRGLRR